MKCPGGARPTQAPTPKGVPSMQEQDKRLGEPADRMQAALPAGRERRVVVAQSGGDGRGRGDPRASCCSARNAKARFSRCCVDLDEPKGGKTIRPFRPRTKPAASGSSAASTARPHSGRYEITFTDSDGRQRWQSVRGQFEGGTSGSRRGCLEAGGRGSGSHPRS